MKDTEVDDMLERPVTDDRDWGWIGWLFAAFKILLPPRMLENGHRDNVERVQLYEFRLRRWRHIVGYVLILLILAVSAEVTLSWGLAPRVFTGFEPKASAQAAANDANARTTRIEKHLLQQSLLSIKQGQCRATDKAYFTDRLNELLDEYQHLTGQPWRVPACDEVMEATQ